MLFDQKALFSDAQTVTGTDTTVTSTNTVDTQANQTTKRTRYGSVDVPHDVGRGNHLPIRAQVTTAFAGGTSVTVQLRTSDSESTGYVTLAQSGPITIANATAGKWFELDYAPHNCKRYLRLEYVLVGAVTAGAITAGVVSAHQSNPADAA